MSDLFTNSNDLSFRCTEIAASLGETEGKLNGTRDSVERSFIQNVSMSDQFQESNDPSFRCTEIAVSLGDEGKQKPSRAEDIGKPCSQELLIIINDDGWTRRLEAGDSVNSTTMLPGAPETKGSLKNLRGKMPGRGSTTTRTLDYYFHRMNNDDSSDASYFDETNPDIYRVDANTVLDPIFLPANPPDEQRISDLSQQCTAVAASRYSLKRKSSVSAIWNHFSKDSVKGLSQCLHCKVWLKSLNASNAKRHLKACNQSHWETVERKDNMCTKDNHIREPKQMKLDFQKTYACNHPKQLALRKKLAILYGCTTISGNVMQTKEFRECFQALDTRIKIPATNTIRKDFQATIASARDKVKKMLKSVKRITISSDIWTKKGNRSSFLGVTATFFYPPLRKKVNVILGVQKFSTVSHTSSDIIREMRKVMAAFEISPKQVWRSITDGASNMICSHRMDKHIFCQTDATQVEDQHQSETEKNSSDDDAMHTAENNPIVRRTEVQSENADNLHLNDVIGDSTRMNPAYRRLTCFIHTTLICLKTFELDPELNAVIERVKTLVSKFSRSAKLMTDLVKQAGLGLVSFSEIRWNYVYLVLARLLRVEKHVKAVLEKHEKQKYALDSDDWEKIQRITEFLKPFHDYTCMVSKEKEAVSSEVIVAVLSMHYHLQKYENVPLLKVAAQNIMQSLKTKFSKWFHDTNDDFEGTYVIATLLDPRYRLMMPFSQRNFAKKYLLNEYSLMISEDSDDIHDEGQKIIETTTIQTHSRYPLIQEMKQALFAAESRNSNRSVDTLEEELNKYLSNSEYDKYTEDIDVFEFWLSRSNEYPLLSPIALDYLSVPDSTANTERTFGTASAFTKGLSNRLDGVNLENRVFLTKNKKLLEDLIEVTGETCVQ